jgi:hypothetical protein
VDLNIKVRTPGAFSGDLRFKVGTHPFLAYLNAAREKGSTSLAPPENGARDFSGPKKR